MMSTAIQKPVRLLWHKLTLRSTLGHLSNTLTCAGIDDIDGLAGPLLELAVDVEAGLEGGFALEGAVSGEVV